MVVVEVAGRHVISTTDVSCGEGGAVSQDMEGLIEVNDWVTTFRWNVTNGRDCLLDRLHRDVVMRVIFTKSLYEVAHMKIHEEESRRQVIRSPVRYV